MAFACDPERLAQASGAAAEEPHVLHAAALALAVEPRGGFERPDQRRLGNPFWKSSREMTALSVQSPPALASQASE